MQEGGGGRNMTFRFWEAKYDRFFYVPGGGGGAPGRGHDGQAGQDPGLSHRRVSSQPGTGA